MAVEKNFVYRVIPSESDSGKTSALKEDELTAIIADALLGEPYAIQLVARFDSNALEMEKDWEMMSEFEKDEFINKKNSAEDVRLGVNLRRICAPCSPMFTYRLSFG